MLEKKPPKEQSGRDTFSRYKAQVRSVAIATLAILEGKEIDRVYCDLHDDFVVRKKDNSGFSYVFYQVKTRDKLNKNWTLSELFGLNSKIKDQTKQDTKKIRDSFVGKLLLHTVVFDKYCNSVVFQTNIHNNDDVVTLLENVESGKYSDKFSQVLLERFNSCYKSDLDKELPQKEIKDNISKLVFETDVQHLKQHNNNFEPIAREKIHEYSEVDLERSELEEILLKLLDLVEKKSSGVIKHLTSETIEELAGISIDDLLSILCISTDAYNNLLEGGDEKAIKSASIIQRSLLKAGASLEAVAYCSRCKTEWDLWLRYNRHILPELDLTTITQHVRSLLSNSKSGNSIDIELLRQPILNMVERLKDEGLLFDLTENLLLGGIFSELVKGKS